MTASGEGKAFLFNKPQLLHSLILLTSDKSEAVAKDACRALINLSAEENGAEKLLAELPSTENV